MAYIIGDTSSMEARAEMTRLGLGWQEREKGRGGKREVLRVFSLGRVLGDSHELHLVTMSERHPNRSVQWVQEVCECCGGGRDGEGGGVGV